MSMISVVVPCYNEEDNVEPMSRALVEIFEKQFPKYSYEIIFIDNNSEDRTRGILRELCKKNHNIKAIFNAKNFGQCNSPVYGLLQSRGECTILLAADFQEPVDMVPKFIEEWEKGFKIVCGIKTGSKENRLLYAVRSLYYKMIKSMSSIEQIEHFTGFGLYDKSFIDTLKNLKEPTPFLRGLVAELGPERKELSYTQQKRRAGKTTNNLYSLYDLAMLSFTSYTKIGLRIATFLGFFIAIISVIIGIYYLVLKFLNWNTFQAGMAPLLVGMFFLGSVQLIFIGLIGEYILSINARVMNRPLVVEEERLNFGDDN